MSVDRHQMRWGMAIAAVVGVMALALWLPASMRLQSARADIVDAEQQLAVARSSVAELSALSDEVDRLRREIGSQNKTVPSRGAMASLLRELSLLIDSIGLTGEGIATGIATETDDAISMPVELELVGRSVMVFELIQRIERLPTMLHVEEFEIETDSADPSKVTASVTLRAFFSPDESGGAM